MRRISISGMKIVSIIFGSTMLSRRKLKKPSRVVTFFAEGVEEHTTCSAAVKVVDTCLSYCHVSRQVIIESSQRET